MKPVGLIGTGILLLLLGAVIPTYALQEHEQDAKPAKQEQQAKPEKRQEAKPAKQQEAKAPKQEQQPKAQKQQEAKAPKQEKQAKPEKQQEAKAPKPEHQQQAKEEHEQQAKPVKQQEARSQQNGQGHVQRTSAEQQRQRAVPALRLSPRGEGRIPDDRFRSNFGSGHRFRIGSPQIVDGYSRFQYGGYWFGFVEPWPEGWYYTDDVYVDFIDGGYYLCNPYYPGVHIAINVVM